MSWDKSLPLLRRDLDVHVEQRIKERMDLSHLYLIEPGPDGPEACATEAAAASIWRVVQDAIQEAGWRCIP
jgi:hypothetical protein